MPIRAVVFDIGEVLEVTPRTGWERKWEARLGLQPGELDRLLRSVWVDGSAGRISEAEVDRSVGEILGLSQSEIEEFMSDLWAEYLGELNADLASYFAGMRPRYRTAIISNSFAGAREKEQERYGLCDMCDLIVYSHEEGIAKPDKRIFELACERLGVQPSEVLFLDDVEPFVEAARELGMQAILFRDTAQAIADIQACLEADEQVVITA